MYIRGGFEISTTVLAYTYSHGQELFYKFVSKITNKLVKQLLSMTVYQANRLTCRYPVYYTTIRRVVKGQVLLAASLYYKFLQYETLPLMGDESWVRPKT